VWGSYEGGTAPRPALRRAGRRPDRESEARAPGLYFFPGVGPAMLTVRLAGRGGEGVTP
jgi:hypothetical protein